jgi:hypothetical protein
VSPAWEGDPAGACHRRAGALRAAVVLRVVPEAPVVRSLAESTQSVVVAQHRGGSRSRCATSPTSTGFPCPTSGAPRRVRARVASRTASWNAASGSSIRQEIRLDRATLRERLPAGRCPGPADAAGDHDEPSAARA